MQNNRYRRHRSRRRSAAPLAPQHQSSGTLSAAELRHLVAQMVD